jgi:hypothetical protein
MSDILTIKYTISVQSNSIVPTRGHEVQPARTSHDPKNIQKYYNSDRWLKRALVCYLSTSMWIQYTHGQRPACSHLGPTVWPPVLLMFGILKCWWRLYLEQWVISCCLIFFLLLQIFTEADLDEDNSLSFAIIYSAFSYLPIIQSWGPPYSCSLLIYITLCLDRK